LAKQIEEAAVGPTAIHQLPHYRAGPYALPHWQPNPRPPAGHSFYETGGVKATPPKPPKPLSKAMKYFTQQLLDQASSPDEAVVEEANTEWNRAIVEYKKYLEKLRPYFTPSLRTFLDEYCMHDAEIVSRGKKAGGQSYFIIAHFEPPSTEGVSLTFTLAGPTKEIGSQRSPSYWAYEEVEKVRVKDRDAFRISILLADGSELQVPFSDMEILRFQVAPSGASPAIRSSIHGRPAGGLSAGTAPPPRKIPRN